MKLSMKSDYALRTLCSLADRHQAGEGPLSIRALAEMNDIPKRFLEQIMLDLKNKGWVSSVPGRDGGYMLAGSPDTLTMGQVVRHFDGVLAPIGCVSALHYKPCSREASCRFRRLLLDIRNFTARLMDGTSLAAVAMAHPVSQEEIFHENLLGGAGI